MLSFIDNLTLSLPYSKNPMSLEVNIQNDSGETVKAEIVQAEGKMPLKKHGWEFDWNKLVKENETKTFVLRIKDGSKSIEGILQLKWLEVRQNEYMLIMNVLEIASHNIGSKKKRFYSVAGCLIAYACRESYKIEGNYRAFLTFDAKSYLVQWYKEKYGAQSFRGQRMYIDAEQGKNLIDQYL